MRVNELASATRERKRPRGKLVPHSSGHQFADVSGVFHAHSCDVTHFLPFVCILDGMDHGAPSSIDRTDAVWGVFIGISEYRDEHGFTPLLASAADAARTYDTFQRVFGMDSRSVLLSDVSGKEHIDCSRVCDELDRLGARLKKQKCALVFYFAGHGYCSGDGTTHLATHDTRNATGGLSVYELKRRLDLTRARSQIVILDVCRSYAQEQARGQRAVISRSAPMSARLARGLIDEFKHNAKDIRDEPDRFIALSCSKGQHSFETEGCGGWFTHHLLLSLSSYQDGEAVGMQDWFERTRDSMSRHPVFQQSPMMEFSGRTIPTLHRLRAHPRRERNEDLHVMATSPTLVNASDTPNDIAVRSAAMFLLRDPSDLTFHEASLLCQRLSSYVGPKRALAAHVASMLVDVHYVPFHRRVPDGVREFIRSRGQLTEDEQRHFGSLLRLRRPQ